MFGLFTDPREKLIRKSAKKAMPIIRTAPRWKMFKYMATQTGAVGLGDLMTIETNMSRAFAEVSLLHFERTGSAPTADEGFNNVELVIEEGIKFLCEGNPIASMIVGQMNNHE